ncbi:MAG: hypothetical protein Q8L10_02085 [Candidatus Moranbacteria bacterium]|nr:hypothetical protein [Candidatus Moranbacteria bacterium]
MLHKSFLRLKPENLIIIYKLLNDSLLLWLALFVFALIAEGLIPGIVSQHLELYKIAFAMLINIVLIHKIREDAQIGNADILNKKIAWPLFFIFVLLLFNSMLKLDVYLSLSILAAVSATVYLIFKAFQKE